MGTTPPNKQFRWTIALTNERYNTTLANGIRSFGDISEAPEMLDAAVDTVVRTMKVRADEFAQLYDALWVPDLWDNEDEEE